MNDGMMNNDDIIYYAQTVLAFTTNDPFGRNAWQHIQEIGVTNGYFFNEGDHLVLHDATRLFLPGAIAGDDRRLLVRSGSWTTVDGQWVFEDAQPPPWLTIVPYFGGHELTYPRQVEAPPRPDGGANDIEYAYLMFEFEGEEQEGIQNVWCKLDGAIHKAKKLYTKQSGIVVPIKKIRGR